MNSLEKFKSFLKTQKEKGATLINQTFKTNSCDRLLDSIKMHTNYIKGEAVQLFCVKPREITENASEKHKLSENSPFEKNTFSDRKSSHVLDKLLRKFPKYSRSVSRLIIQNNKILHGLYEIKDVPTRINIARITLNDQKNANVIKRILTEAQNTHDPEETRALESLASYTRCVLAGNYAKFFKNEKNKTSNQIRLNGGKND